MQYNAHVYVLNVLVSFFAMIAIECLYYIENSKAINETQVGRTVYDCDPISMLYEECNSQSMKKECSL